MNRHFAARRSHSDADVPGSQRGRVIDAIAHHRNLVAFGFYTPHELDLVLRQALAFGFLAADFEGYTGSDRLAIPGNHRDAANAAHLQCGQGLTRLRPRLVLQPDPAETRAVARHEDQAPALGLIEIDRFKEIFRHAVVLEPLRPAYQHLAAADFGHDPPPGALGEILRLGQRHARFARQLRQRLGG